MSNESVYTVQEVADQLGKSVPTIRDWMTKGLLTPFRRVGTVSLFRQEDIDNRTPPRPAHRPVGTLKPEGNGPRKPKAVPTIKEPLVTPVISGPQECQVCKGRGLLENEPPELGAYECPACDAMGVV